MRVQETNIETNSTHPTVGYRTPLSPVLARGISVYAIVGTFAKVLGAVASSFRLPLPTWVSAQLQKHGIYQRAIDHL